MVGQPRMTGHMKNGTSPLLEVKHLRKTYRMRGGLTLTRTGRVVHALDGVSFRIHGDSALGIVGESGSGKSTLARLVLMLERPTAGTVFFRGIDLNRLSRGARRSFREKMQMVFQDPYESLDPRYAIGRAVGEPLAALTTLGRTQRATRVVETLEEVGLRPAERYLDSLPHELSGGERQRAAIARATVLKPPLLFADEPVSMLDVSLRIGILNLLANMRETLHGSIALITHNLAIARYACSYILVLYAGQAMEYGPTDEILHSPLHPYTRLLLSASPRLLSDRQRQSRPSACRGQLQWEGMTGGCPFGERCPDSDPTCMNNYARIHITTRAHISSCAQSNPQEGS